MTFLRGLAVRSDVENPLRPLTDSTLLSALGGRPTYSGVSVTPESALRVGAAMRGTQIIAGAIAGLPLKARRVSDDSPVAGYHALRPRREDQVITSFELLETAVAHMVLWGNAYLFKVRNSFGSVTSLLPIHPARVTVAKDDEAAREVGLPFVKRFTVDGKHHFSNYEVLHIPCLSLDGIKGLGPIGYVRETFGIAMAAEQAAARLYGNGLMLQGFLTTELSIDQAKASELHDRWMAKYGGTGNAGDVAFLGHGLKWQSLGMNPDDAQFLETRKFQVTEIARLLGLPGWMVNDQEKSTSWGTGMEQQFTTFVILTLKPYMQRIEQRITFELYPESQYAEFVVEGLLRGDSRARAAFYASGIQHGWMVPNEPRALENLPPVPWGDVPYRPFNKSAGDTDPGADDDQPPRGDDEEDEA